MIVVTIVTVVTVVLVGTIVTVVTEGTIVTEVREKKLFSFAKKCFHKNKNHNKKISATNL